MATRVYLCWFFGLLISGSLLVGGVNVVIDPYGIYNLINLPTLNAQKHRRMIEGGRIPKSIDLRRGRYNTLILGSSRAQVGIDPKSPILLGTLAYNASLADASIYELRAVGLYALKHQKLEKVILGLDFFVFNAHRNGSNDFSDSGFAGRSAGYMYLRRLISVGTLEDSLTTALANLVGKPSQNRSDGYLDGAVRYGMVDPRVLFTRVLKAHFLVTPTLYGSLEYQADRVAVFKGLIERFAREGIAVHAFFSPIHARQLEAIRALGWIPTFERWKRDVVTAVEQVNAGLSPSRGSVAIWDFSGYNNITTEAVPVTGEGRATKWYWESSHYKRAVGELILLRMLRPERAKSAVPQDFGRLLSSGSLDGHLGSIRLAAKRYRQNYPIEVADVEQMVRETELARRVFD